MKTTIRNTVVLPRGFVLRAQQRKRQAKKQALKQELSQLIIIILAVSFFIVVGAYSGAI